MPNLLLLESAATVQPEPPASVENPYPRWQIAVVSGMNALLLTLKGLSRWLSGGG